MAFSAALGLAGQRVTSALKHEFRAGAHRALHANAKLRAGQLAQWRGERLGNGRSILASPQLVNGLDALLRGAPVDPGLLQSRLSAYLQAHRYDSATLLDAHGEVRLFVGRPWCVPKGEPWARARAARSVEILDLHADRRRLHDTDISEDPTDRPHLALVVPVAGPDGSPDGVLLVRIDPELWIFPVLKADASEGHTSDTLLVRPEGDHLTHLNRPRFSSLPPGALRRPIGEGWFAVQPGSPDGPDGLKAIEARDYRGAKVLASMARVDGSDWWLVSKIDAAETYAPLATLQQLIAISLAGLVGLTGLAIALVWRRRESAFAVERAQVASERDELLAHFKAISHLANDVLFLLDERGRILDVNDRATQTYGWQRADMLAMHMDAVRVPEARAEVQERLKELATHGSLSFETTHLRRDGTTFPAEVSWRTVTVDGARCIMAVVRDISSRREADLRIRRLNRFYALLSATDKAILRYRDRKALLDAICRVAIETGGFRMAWIGFVQDDLTRVVVEARAADSPAGVDYIDGLDIDLGDPRTGRGLVGEAARTGRRVIVSSLADDARMAPWREAGLRVGYGSAAALPVRLRERVVGVITLYAQEVGFFDEQEEELLDELAGDVGYALEFMALEEQRAAAESAVRANEQWFRTLAAISPVGILRLDAAGNCAYVNEQVVRITGLSPEALTGRQWLAAVDEEDRDAIAVLTDDSLPRERPTTAEFRVRRADGGVVWVLARTVPEYGPDGVKVGIVGTVVDITDRRRAEDELQRNMQWLRLFFDLPFVGMAIADPDAGRWMQVNDQLCTMLGYSRDELLELTWLDVSFRDDVPAELASLERVLEGESDGYVLDKRFVRKDGSRIDATVDVKCVRRPDGSVESLVATVQDTTARNAATAALHDTQRRLLQAQKLEAIGRLAGGVAHDFNNILGVILGYGQMVSDTLGPEHRARPDVDEVLRAAERAAALTRQLLAFSRKQVLQPRVADLNELVADHLRMLQRLIGEDVELRTELFGGLWRVKADPAQLDQVLLNLAVNARDAMPTGGVLTLATSNLSIGPEDATDRLVAGEYVQLQVRDTGIGMDADTQAHVFEPFFTTKPEGQGTGLGLATVYGIVDQSGGAITLRSAPGAGTTFTVCLPRHVAHDDELTEPAGADAPREVPPARRTILLVEDQEPLRLMIREALTKAGYGVVDAGGPLTAMAMVGHGCQFDLLLTDVVMPGMSGFELAERVAAERPGVRVLFMSGYTSDVIARHGPLEPGRHLIEKPFTLARLVSIVRQALSPRGDVLVLPRPCPTAIDLAAAPRSA